MPLCSLPTVSAEATCHLHVESVERFSGDAQKVAEELASLTGQIVIACPSAGEQQRLAELLHPPRPAEGARLDRQDRHESQLLHDGARDGACASAAVRNLEGDRDHHAGYFRRGLSGRRFNGHHG